MRNVTLYFFVILLGLMSCYRGDLKPAPEPIGAVASGTGEFCTLNPEDLEYPVKVLFVLDNSCSMSNSDPGQLRKQAVAQVADEYLPKGGFYFGVSIFGHDMKLMTPAEEPFTDDPVTLQSAIDSMPGPNGHTNYHAALSQSFGIIEQDILDHPKESPRTTYVVMFMSDGNPTDGLSHDNYLSLVKRIRDIQDAPKPYGCLRSTFNTAWLMNGGTPGGPLESLLMDMASTGSGTYQQFENSSEIDFSDIDLSFARRTFSLWNLMVSNMNVMPTPTGVGPDSDADGLLDEQEEAVGTNPLKLDTDADGCRDQLEFDLGWPATEAPQPDDPAHCMCEDLQRMLDDDGDGLTNCEEQFTMTSGMEPDSDIDGFIDRTEMAFGSRPILNDTNRDEDLDEVLNGQEIRIHRDPLNDDVDAHEEYAYVYDTQLREELANGMRCYDITVENIAVLPLKGGRETINTVEIIAAQTPSDQPGEDIIYSRATIQLTVEGEPGSSLAESVSPQEFTFDTSSFQLLNSNQ